MRDLWRLSVVVLLIHSILLPSGLAQTNLAVANSSNPTGLALEEGTPVKLRISRTVSSADAQVGETVDFEVLEEVKVGNLVVIPKGGTAWATVTAAESKKRMARGGKLDMNIDSVRLADGEKAALRAVKYVKGGGHTGAMTGGIVATAIVFWPAAPFFLFMHGKDITVPKGTEITAYVNGNFPLDYAKFQSNGAQVQIPAQVAQSSTHQSTSATSAVLDISSTPANAEIELDGSFAGDTPSAIGVVPGEHTIRVTKKGYMPWERKVRSSSGNVKLLAELEPATPAPSVLPTVAPSVASNSTPSTSNSVASAFVAGTTHSSTTSTVAETGTQVKPAVVATETVVGAPSSGGDAEATVWITCDPAGADIFVDSVGHGRAPAVLKLKPGKHHIQLVHRGYKDSVREIEVSAGSTVTVMGKLEQ